MSIREEASGILGIRIEPDKWIESVDYIDAAGMVDRKKQIKLILMLCQRVEALENDRNTPKPK